MGSVNITDFLAEQLENAPPQCQASFLTFEDYWERKLWHQLTDALIYFFRLPESAPQRLPLFKSFILSFADRINQLKFVSLGLMASTESPSRCPYVERERERERETLAHWLVFFFFFFFCPTDDQERLAFLTALAKRVNKEDSQDAYVYALADVANVKLRLQDFDGAQKDLQTCQKVLDTFDSVETVVHASFYKVNADYYHVSFPGFTWIEKRVKLICSDQAKEEFAAFYRNALLYLACINLEDLTEQERISRAYNLSVAALVSDSIYNFGELLLHPILDSLTETPHNWLRDLLFAFNRGDLTAYDVMAGNIIKNELLEQSRIFLYQKISLAALTEMVFRRPPHDRNLSFISISSETKVKPNEIEHLVMKALSLGLLSGSIDQVAQIAQIDWVQPKVLDMKQIEGMRNRLREWDGGVNQLGVT